MALKYKLCPLGCRPQQIRLPWWFTLVVGVLNLSYEPISPLICASTNQTSPSPPAPQNQTDLQNLLLLVDDADADDKKSPNWFVGLVSPAAKVIVGVGKSISSFFFPDSSSSSPSSNSSPGFRNVRSVPTVLRYTS